MHYILSVMAALRHYEHLFTILFSLSLPPLDKLSQACYNNSIEQEKRICMNYAILDIGSNTVKMSVFDAEKKLLAKYSQPTSLLSYVEKRCLTDEGIEKLTDTITGYQKTALEKHTAKICAYATASLRGLTNAELVMESVKNATGIAIDLISGDDEARLAFDGIAAVSGIDPYGDTVFDLGGGSLEIAACKDGSFYTRSYPVGALAVYLAFVKNILPTKEELSTIYAHVKGLIDPNTPKKRGKALAVGGTLRALCLLLAHDQDTHYDEKLPYTVTRGEAIDFLTKIVNCDKKTKLLLISLTPKRIHTLAAGLTAFLALLDVTGQTGFTVVNGGTRDGYLNKILAE